MRTRFTYLGDTVIECTVDGDSMTWNVLPALPAPPAAEVPACAPVAAPDIGAAAAGPLLAAPLSEPVVAAPPGRALPAFIRGVYTVIFSLLGMAGAGFAYLRDNLDKLTDIKWQTVAIFVGGALLAGIAYGLKKYWKPDGLL